MVVAMDVAETVAVTVTVTVAAVVAARAVAVMVRPTGAMLVAADEVAARRGGMMGPVMVVERKMAEEMEEPMVAEVYLEAGEVVLVRTVVAQLDLSER